MLIGNLKKFNQVNIKIKLPTSLSILGLLAALPPFEFELAAILRFFSSTYNNKLK